MIRVDSITGPHDLAREDLIDLRELLELRDNLRDRTLCATCYEPAHEDPEGEIVHTESGRKSCDSDEFAAQPDEVARLVDPLDADEVALLAELDRFDREEVYGDLHCAHSAEPTLIAESYWRTFAEEMADEFVFEGREGGIGREFFDYDKWADHIRQDYTEVTLAGETFLRRA